MKRIADQTLYEILDVPDDAPAAEISAACDRARALYGPGSLATYTLMSAEEASLLTSRIDEARATLLDPGARARYDEALHARAGAARAASGASAPASFPPVIPAAAPPEPPRPPEAVPTPPPRAEQPARAEPVRLLAPAAEAQEPVAEAQEPVAEAQQPAAEGPAAEPPAPPPPPAPIRLEREIAPPEAPPAAAARTPVPAAAPPPPAPLPSVPEGSPWTGEVLRAFREARGLSVQQIAERTKVTRHHIENIEAERFGALPAPVYLRGILLALARELRLDGQKVARSYLERAAAAKGR